MTYTLQEAIALTQMLVGGRQYTANWHTIRKELDDLTNAHVSMRYRMDNNWRLFRGRIDNDIEHFENVSDLSNRKASDIKDYGRCHNPGTSTFYGGNNLDTVLAEIKPDIDDLVHIAIARPKMHNEIVITAIGEIDHVRRTGLTLIADDESRKEIDEILNNIQNEDHLKTIFLDAFMSELFIKPANQKRDYKATSALSHILFSKEIAPNEHAIDGFAYPSVAHRGGINFAIKGSEFEQKMEIHECMTFKIVADLGYGLYGRKLKAKSKTIHEDGKIEWETVTASK